MSNVRLQVRTSPFWICGLATLCVGAGVPHAFASPQNPQMYPGTSIKVKYHDLDLSTQAGAEALYTRIQRAARRVCDLDREPADPFRLSHWQYCYKAAVANAVNDVNNKNLTAMYREKNKLSPVS